MTTIKIKTTEELLHNIIKAYNKEYKESITVIDIKSLILGLPIMLNDKPVSWETVKLFYLWQKLQ